jgi:hypothetical protein
VPAREAFLRRPRCSRPQDLNALVLTIHHPHHALGIDRYSVRDVELTRPSPFSTPRGDQSAIPVDVTANVSGPNVPVAIDMQPVRPGEQRVTEAANERPIRIEFKESLRAASKDI